MKKALAISGVIALTITPTTSFADHLDPKESEIRPGGDLAHTNLRGRNLSGAFLDNANLKGADLTNAKLNYADLSGADLSGAFLTKANLNGITANNIKGCPLSLPGGWVCEKNSLIQSTKN